MEALTAVFVGIIAAVGGGIGLHVWQRYFLERISVKRITKPTDTHVQGLLDLYKSNFLKNDDDTNYSLSEVAEFMNDKFEERRHVEGENIVLVAILKSEVVGFLFCHFYPERRKAIISYFAIDKRSNEARLKAADRLLLKLKKVLIKGNECDALFYESEGSDPVISKHERRERDARRVLFKLKAKAHGLKALEFQFQYECARVSLSDDLHERPFSLFCIGIREQIPVNLPKKQLLEYLRFIHLDCYGDVYLEDDPRFEKHQAYLRTRLEHYEKNLPDTIPVA